MSTAIFNEIIHDRTGMVPLTLEQYHMMIKNRILPEGEPIELLDGYLVHKDRSQRGADPMTVGSKHAWVIHTLKRLFPAQSSCHLRIQSPISVPPDSEPEPDAAIAAGDEDRYRDRHPSPSEVPCVIEVADSSLHRDRTTKLRIYADAGISQYVIINLVDDRIEDYRQPSPGSGRYAAPQTLHRGQTISLSLPDNQHLDIGVSELLP